MLAFIAQQLGITPVAFLDYARRDATRRGHLLELQAMLGLRAFGLGDYRSLPSWALEVARQTDRGEVIVSALVEEVRRRRIVLRGSSCRAQAFSSGSGSLREPAHAPRRTPILWPASRRSNASGCTDSSRSR